MKKITHLLIYYLAIISVPGYADESTNISTIRDIGQGNKIELVSKQTIKHSTQGLDLGVGIVDGKLYRSFSGAPFCILTKGTLLLNGAEIELDVSGIGDPWIDPTEFMASQCNLTTYISHFGEKVYTLKIAFVKGGADEFMVTWKIYQGLSLRTSIIQLGDTPVDW